MIYLSVSARDGTSSKDPWQAAPDPVVQPSKKSKKETSQNPEQDTEGEICLERQQQSSSGEKWEPFLPYQDVLWKVVGDRDHEPGPKARCICAECENWEKSPTLITSQLHPGEADSEPAELFGELRERFEKKGSRNLEQNVSDKDANNAKKQQPNPSGNEPNESIFFGNVLKDPVQDSGPGQEVCLDGEDQGECLTLVNHQELPSGKDSECVALSEEL